MSSASCRYLDVAAMAGIEPVVFQQQSPFPWANPQGFIVAERYPELLASMPDISEFRSFFGKQRKHGQASHDRYVLDYEEGMVLPQPWQELLSQLRGDVYRDFICRLLNVPSVRFRFHWHYTPSGAEVSPHCDSKAKIGSQIFYLNTDQDWDVSWGGETVILDDGGRFDPGSNPAFEDFSAEYPALTSDNRSILFGRRGNSWHGVRRIACPENVYRKVFIVVFEEHRPLHMAWKRMKRRLAGKPTVTHKESLMY